METNGNAKPVLSRGWKVVLVASLGLNLAVVGLIGGAFWHGGPGKGPGLRGDRVVFALGLRPYWRAMSPDQKAALRKDLKASDASALPGGLAMRQHIEALAEALEAEPFAVGRVQQLLAGQSDALGRNFAFGQELLVTRIAGMSPAERAAFANALRKGKGNRPFRRRN